MLPSSSGSLSANGMEMSLAALQRLDPGIRTVVDVASHVALYTFSSQSLQWEKTEVEGTLFIYSRSTSPRHGFTIMNRLNMQNLSEAITRDLDMQLQEPFLLYRNAGLIIHGIWFYNQQDCHRITGIMQFLTQQEMVRSQRKEDGAAVDILQMLSRAQSLYEEKLSPEPKEIRVSEDVHRNLIKPIPVKPSTQDFIHPGSRTVLPDSLFGSLGPESATYLWRPTVGGSNTCNSGAMGRPDIMSRPFNQSPNCPAFQKLNQRSLHSHTPHHQPGQLPILGSSPPRPQHAFSPVSPHDLFQRLKLVQQGMEGYVGLHAIDQPQLDSPQSIPVTKPALPLLLSPSVFAEVKSRDSRVLSRSQLQAALLHLIQSDASFLDNIYHTYVSRSTNICSRK